MSGSVIQGSFPNGIAQLHAAMQRGGVAQPGAHVQPDWVRQRVAQPHMGHTHGQPSRPSPHPHPHASPALQLRPTPNGTAALLPPHLAPHANLPGQPLPNDVRQRMESMFRTTFHDVRVHVGPHVQALGAHAYTHGSQIHFAPGQYDPASQRGQQMLAHELAHVVQQRTGRARNPFGTGVAVVHDAMLEAEAERRSREALHAPAAAIQPLASQAAAYIRLHNLGINATFIGVSAYVASRKNLEEHRLGLMRAWNKPGGKKRSQPKPIAMPNDLKPTQVTTFTEQFDFSAYDSDDDKKMNIGATITKTAGTNMITLVRGDGSSLTRPVLDPVAVIRIGRQIARTGIKGSTHLPFVGKYGAHYIEFASPGTEDIYAYPLKTTTGGYKRAGSNSDFNWKNLAAQLDQVATTKEERLAKRRKIFTHFTGKSSELTGDEAEAVGAIACDFLKGSGNSVYVKKVLEEKKDMTFKQVFVTDLLYEPAQEKGRKLATLATAKNKEEKKQQQGTTQQQGTKRKLDELS